MLDFGWKKKAEQLRMVLLSSGHQLAKELPPDLVRVLDVFRRVAKAEVPQQEIEQELDASLPESAIADDVRPLWELTEIYGWRIEATLYLKHNALNPGRVELWWLVHAIRCDEDESPSDKQLAFLDKALKHLGAEPTRDAIITPLTGDADGEARIPFGWWAWINRWPLYEIQVNKDKKKDREKIRVVPLGASETDGYTALDAETPSGTDVP